VDGAAVRRLGAADVPTMRRLNRLFGEAFEDPQAYDASPPDDAWLEALLGRDHVVVLVAERSELLGGLVAYELDKLEQQRRELYVYDLAVAAPHRRQGIATALLAELRRHAARRGAWTIFIQADIGDEAPIALYAKLGTREEVLHFDIPPELERAE
jgi:aminoglycoside 3-N-acetyltransferase I